MLITLGLCKTWGGIPDGAAWLDRLESLVSGAASRWSLDVGPVFPGSNVAYVAPVTRSDGTRAVLKLMFPECESAHEPDALIHWAGHGAVRLIDHDPERRALLMDLVTPGTPLTACSESEALEVGAEILRSLRRPPPPENPFRQLDTLATGWASDIRARWEERGRPFERSLLDFAIAQIGELVGTASEAVVLHQDLHAGNILDAGAGRWLAIDPKPLVGDPAFDTASLLRDRRDDLCRDPDPERRMRWRLDTLADLTGLDRERKRGWGVVHALAWGLGSEVDEKLVACARWLRAAG